MPPKQSLLDKLRADERARAEQEANATQLAAKRASDIKAYQQKLKDEEENKLREQCDEEERAARLAEERRIAEIKRKTKPYFVINNFGRKQVNTLYFGDWIGAPFGDAWVPHGEGEHRHNDRVFLKGTFQRG